MANFDSDYFYQITLESNAVTSLATSNTTNNGTGSVFFQITNTSQANQKWQLFNAKDDSYVLRSGNSGPWGYLVAVESDSSSKTNTGNTVPAAWNVENITDDSMYWTVKPWGDGSFFMQNSANGSDWHLELESNGLMTMSSNITGDQTMQKFKFNKLGKITNTAFETIALPPSSTSSAKPTQTSISLSSDSASSGHSFSTAAIAGIAAGVGALAILCVILGVLLFLRRRKNKRAQSVSETTAYSNLKKVQNTTEGASPMPWSPAPQYNYAMAAQSPHLYPSRAPSPVPTPPPPAFVELSQEAQRHVSELGSDGQGDGAVGLKDGRPSTASPATNLNAPVEMDAQENTRHTYELGS